MNGDDYRRAYSRGYYAGSKRSWPEHRPPAPPDGIMGPVVAAAQALRDRVDAEIATFEPGDEMGVRLAAKVDDLDDALRRLTTWLKEQPE